MTDFLHQAIDRTMDELDAAAREPTCHTIDGHHQQIERLRIRGFDLKRQVNALPVPATGTSPPLESEVSRWLQDAHIACHHVERKARDRDILSELAKAVVVLFILAIVVMAGLWIFVINVGEAPLRPDFTNAEDVRRFQEIGLDGIARGIFFRTLLFAMCGALVYSVATMLRNRLGPAIRKTFAAVVLAVPVAMVLSVYRATVLFDAAQRHAREAMKAKSDSILSTLAGLGRGGNGPDTAKAAAEIKTSGHAIVNQAQGLAEAAENLLNGWMQASETMIYIIAFGVMAVLPPLLVRVYALIEGALGGARAR